MNRISTLLLLCFWVWGLEGISAGEVPGGLKIKPQAIRELGLKFEPVELIIPEVKRNYTFIFVNDLHIIAGDLSAVTDRERPKIERKRVKTYRHPLGLTAEKIWKKLPDVLNQSGADAIFFGGDMIDYGSPADMDCLQAGLDKITKVPFMYIRANHDYLQMWMREDHTAYIMEKQREIDGNPEILVREYDDLVIVGINNSTENMTASGLAAFKKAYALGKPMIVLIHVPVHSVFDNSLEEKCLSLKEKRKLYWGKGCFFKPRAPMQEFIRMITQPNSLVKAVFSGHLHFSWDGKLSTTVRAHLFEAAYRGNIGVITVKSQPQ